MPATRDIPDPFPQGPPFNAEQLLKALRHLLQLYCRAAGVPPDDTAQLNPAAFLGWLRDARTVPCDGMALPLFDQVDAIAARLEVPGAAVRFAVCLGSRDDGLARLGSLWPYLVLDGRQTVHAIRSVQVMLVVQWMDDVVCPLSRMAHVDSSPGPVSGPITDADVAAMALREGSALAQLVLGGSCDALHDAHLRLKGIASPGVLANIMLACEDAVKAGRLAAADLVEIQKTVVYAGTMLPRQIPDSVLRQFLNPSLGEPFEPVAPVEPPASPGKPVGGWDA